MYVVTPLEMNTIDKLMAEKYSMPTLLLMENAGAAVATYITQSFDSASRILVLAGSGNNGGDGWVAARHLFAMGYDVKVLSLCGEDRMRDLVLSNYKLAAQLGVDHLLECTQEDVCRNALWADVIVDAILGTGVTGNVNEAVSGIIDTVNLSRKKVVSVDVPSGINALDGTVCGIAIMADHLVVLGTYKQGLLYSPAREHYKSASVESISIPNSVFAANSQQKQVLSPKEISAMLKPRPMASHKGSFGKLGIIAGSVGMTGAACLCATAAQKSGAGIIQLAVPQSLNPIFEVKLTEQMTCPMPENQKGALCHSRELMDFCDGKTALVIGPGLSLNADGTEFIPQIIRTFGGNIVVDADGLNLIRNNPEVLAQGNCVITPHPGEMSRLTGYTVRHITENQRDVALEFAQRYNVTVVLKDHVTVIASPDGRCVFNTTGNCGMATGGSGDVLSGIIGSLLAQGYSTFDAAVIGAFVNGYAADIAAEAVGVVSLAPTDTANALADAFVRLGM